MTLSMTVQQVMAYLQLVAPGLSLTAFLWLVGAVGLALLLVGGGKEAE